MKEVFYVFFHFFCSFYNRFHRQKQKMHTPDHVSDHPVQQQADGNAQRQAVKHHTQKNKRRQKAPLASLSDAQAQRILDTAARIWGIGKTAMIVHLCEVVTNLICDVQDHYRAHWQAGQDPEGKHLWMDLEKAVDGLYDALNPTGGEYDESWRTPEAYDALRLAIWGPEKEERAPSVYLANDRIWIVARGRTEARECLLRELGLSRPQLSGVALGTMLEDGRTVGDLVPLAACIPSIVARTTA